MRIFIIGGTRFIGPYVVRQLVIQSHDVTVFHRGQTNTDLPPEVQHILGDRNNLPDHRNDIQKSRPDVVLDMIPVVEKHAEIMMDALNGLTERVVSISSCDVYRAYGILHGKEIGLEPVPLTEGSPVRQVLYPYRTDPPRPKDDPMAWIDYYDKIPIERRILNDPNLSGTVLRLPAVYGPGDNQHRLFSILKRIDDKRSAIIFEKIRAQWRFSRGYVENVAAAIVLAITKSKAAGKIYNVAEQYACTETEWAQKIATATNWPGNIISLPNSALPEALQDTGHWEQDLAIDSARIREELGYREIVSPEESLTRTIAWERDNPPPKIDEKQFDYAAEDAVLAQLESDDK